MKFLIAFAFLAMASAAEAQIQLPEPAAPLYEIPDISPMLVPFEVMEEVRKAELSGVPLDMSDADNFVDAVAEDAVANEGLAVHFVDVVSNVEAVQAEEIAEIPAEPVNFVEAPLEEVQPAEEAVPFDAKDLVVNFVDSPINEAQDDIAVKVVEAPLPIDEQINRRESVIVAEEPMIEQMQFRLPGKHFADPRLRGF